MLFLLVTSIAWVTWHYGAQLNYNGLYLIEQPEKRIYIIFCLYLIWLLELLITDAEITQPHHFSDQLVQKKMLACKNRLNGAFSFLKKTTVTKFGKQIYLSQLPWVLLIGPGKAGKTSLLANANIRFILQRQFSKQDGAIESSAQADWWVTSENTIVDIPGRYLLPMNAATKSHPEAGSAPVLWRYFLQLIEKRRGKHGINGIILTLPLAELIRHPDGDIINGTINHCIRRLNEIHHFFSAPIPVTIVLTKCDLFTGFKEYFAELGNDEATQAWGIDLGDIHEQSNLLPVYKQRFNALIKKLNEQLLAKLHQERNSSARPNIKEFPLEIERIKDRLEDILKKITSHCPNFTTKGIYLTSSLQQLSSQNDKALSNSQLLDIPDNLSRTYFIKQLLSIGISNGKRIKPVLSFSHRAVYLLSATLIITTGILLGRDFERGLSNVYALQKQITNYQFTSKEFHNRDEKLRKTLGLLNNLHQATKINQFHPDINHLLSFYTFKSQETANLLYRQAVQNILLPQVKHYLEDYLKLPVNKSNDQLYTALESYLMLGNSGYFDADYITLTVQKILPKTFSSKEIALINQHLKLAFADHRDNYLLDDTIISKARDVLTSHPQIDLAELILRNTGNNNQISEIQLIQQKGIRQILMPKKARIHIKNMYTAKNFPKILAGQIQTASQQAILGNWVLGNLAAPSDTEKKISELNKQLYERYIQHYASTWEGLLDSIRLYQPQNLAQTNTVINELVGNKSPLLQFLQTVRDNTFLKPVSGASQRLKSISLLLDKNTVSEKQLYQIFSGLQSLHHYIEPVVKANKPDKIAFGLIKEQMQHKSIDPITQLRLIADKNPEPLKKWLNQLANDTWQQLSKEAGNYLNTAWKNTVLAEFNSKIARHYPFDSNTDKDVTLDTFKTFFGNPGTIVSFYQDNLKPLIDESKGSWHWKKRGQNTLPFSEISLAQIQHAMRIHHAFFPNGDNELFVQFALTPYQFGKPIKKVKIQLCSKEITDEKTDNVSHMFTWPGKGEHKPTLVELTLEKDKHLSQNISGDWSWFKLVNSSFDSVVSKKQIALNLSRNEVPAKYYLYTKGKTNPFISLNMKHFKLAEKLT